MWYFLFPKWCSFPAGSGLSKRKKAFSCFCFPQTLRPVLPFKTSCVSSMSKTKGLLQFFHMPFFNRVKKNNFYNKITIATSIQFSLTLLNKLANMHFWDYMFYLCKDFEWYNFLTQQQDKYLEWKEHLNLLKTELFPPTSQHRGESHMDLWKMLMYCLAECFVAVFQVEQISLCSLGEIVLPVKQVMCLYVHWGHAQSA